MSSVIGPRPSRRASAVVPVVVVERHRTCDEPGLGAGGGGLPLAEVTLRTACRSGSRCASWLSDPACSWVPARWSAAEQVGPGGRGGRAVHRLARVLAPPWCASAARSASRSSRASRPPPRSMAALEAGVDVVKFFPAEPLGGVPIRQGARRAVPVGALRADRRHQPDRRWPATSPCRRSWPSAAPGWSRPTSLGAGRLRPGSLRGRRLRSRSSRDVRGWSDAVTLRLRPAEECRFDARRPRRGHAAPRPRRGPHPHRPQRSRSGRAAASTTSRAACAAASACARRW